MDYTPKGTKEEINRLLSLAQAEINALLEQEDAPPHLLLFFEDKVKSQGRKQVEDIEKRMTDFGVL